MTHAPAVDLSVIEELRELETEDPNLVADLIDEFLKSTPVRIAKIRAAISASRPDEVGRIAHALKSGAGALGAVRLSETSRTLEHMGRVDNLDGARALAETLQQEYELARAEFLAIRAGRKAA